MTRLSLATVFSIVFALTSAHASAQATAPGQITISGVVTDTTGAVLAGSTVEVSAGDRHVATLTTGIDGRYRVALDANTQYRLRVFLDGFADQTVELQTPAADTTRDFVLTIGSLRDAVVVTAEISQHLTIPAATSSRLQLSSLQTPASVEIITGESMQVIADKTISAVASRATGIVNTSSAFGYSLNARGFNGYNSVMQLYDGMRMYQTTITFPSDPWMAERLEVLRGPASVLYGEGAIGAAINVVRRQPTRVRQNEVKVSAASFNTLGLGAGSGGPLTDRLSYRVDLGLNRSSGWMDRGESSNTAMSGALRLDASDRLRFTLTHDFTDANPTTWFGVPTINGVFNKDLRKKNYNVADSDLHFTDTWTQLKMNWVPASNVSVDSNVYYLTTDKHWRNSELQAFNPATSRITLGTFLEIYYNQGQVGNRTQIRYDSKVAGRDNQLVAGFDVNRGTLERRDNSPFSGSATVDVFDPVPVPFINQAGTLLKFDTRLFQYAAFAEDRFVLSPRWSVVSGLRLDRPTVERIDAINPAASFTTTFGSASGRVGVVFNPTATTALYGQYATASDPVSALVTTNVAQKDFDVSTGRQWEAGIKNSFWGGRGEWTFAAYDIVKEKLLTRDALDPGITVQIGQQSAHGAEGSLALSVGGGVHLQANASFVDPRFDDFAESVGGVRISRNGNVPQDTARRSANFIALWHVGGKWTANTAVRYVGQRFQDAANLRVIPSYTVVDTTLQREVFENGIVGLTVRNLTDELYARNIYGSTTQWIVGDPRSVELSLRVRF
jgi:iron complex outermembrane receptor protein